jgi:hypothetical protein
LLFAPYSLDINVMSLNQANQQDESGPIVRFRKALNTPVNADSRLIAVVEFITGLSLLVATLVRPIDWNQLWPTGRLEVGSPLPWAVWWISVVVTNLLIYHAVSVFRRKRWAVIVTASFATVAFVYSLVILTNQALVAYHSLPSKTPFRDYSWWITWLGWSAIYYSVCKEGIQALRRRGVYSVASQPTQSPQILAEPEVVPAEVAVGG